MSDCNWSFYPKNVAAPDFALELVGIFDATMDRIDSESHDLRSNEVLSALQPLLSSKGYDVEKSKKKEDLIEVPVLYGRQGAIEKSFYADALQQDFGLVVEVEAGRAVANNQFLKDLFEACMMVDIDYLAIAVRNTYSAGAAESRDFERVCTFFDALYASNRLALPLKGILVIGY
ncbi:MAG: hypothetical protein ACOX69_09255 [Coriobacteriales bacterium]|jgi:hypothetical protein